MTADHLAAWNCQAGVAHAIKSGAGATAGHWTIFADRFGSSGSNFPGANFPGPVISSGSPPPPTGGIGLVSPETRVDPQRQSDVVGHHLEVADQGLSLFGIKPLAEGGLDTYADLNGPFEHLLSRFRELDQTDPAVTGVEAPEHVAL